MNKMLKRINRLPLHKELALIITFLLIVTVSLIGISSYYTAKAELDKSGQIILKNSVKMVREAIKLKNVELEKGFISLEDAQEDIKVYILGPKASDGTRAINKNIDLGENGYIFVLSPIADEIAHPSIEGQNTWDTLDMSGDQVYVAREIIEKALNGGGFTYYSWKYPFSEKIAPKVAYSEYDPSWDWIISASIYLEDYNKGAYNILIILILTTLLSLVIGFLVMVFLLKTISSPIQGIAKALLNFDILNPQTPQMEVVQGNEIGQLSGAFNTMTKDLKTEYQKRLESEVALKQLNLELESRVEERTQALIQANYQLEEMKRINAMSRMIFGVAHEINTPLGNAITLNSYGQKILNDHLSSPDAMTTQEDLISVTESVGQNLASVAKLVDSFKRLSPSELSHGKKDLPIAEVITGTIHEVCFDLNFFSLTVDLQGEKSLYIPDINYDLAIIIRQLTENSILHGFQGENFGKLLIEYEVNNSDFCLNFTDDGKGVEDQDLQEVFNPFFTTNRSKGSIGLGLTMLYNIVTDKRKGQISISPSKDKDGVHVRVRFSIQEHMASAQ